MKALKKHISDEKNGLDYVRIGDYYFPDLRLTEETRPIGRWGRMHKDYLEQHHAARYSYLHDYPDEGSGGHNRGAEGLRPHGVGGGDEQHSQLGGRNHPMGDDL